MQINKDEGNNAEFFKEQIVMLLGGLPALELFPEIDKLDMEEQFRTYRNEYGGTWLITPSSYSLLNSSAENVVSNHGRHIT